MTHYGLNPSFAGPTSPLPLFADALRRGIPMPDGRLRLFDGVPCPLVHSSASIELTTGGSGATFTSSPPADADQARLRQSVGNWHRPSLEALAALRPSVLRTLDWSMANHRPDWSKPRVLSTDRLQATKAGMAVELQAEAANLLGCHLWWCAPPRFELTVAQYEARLEELLATIKAHAHRAPILEYGNELWNAAFPVHVWLQNESMRQHSEHVAVRWHDVAAQEIALLERVADRVFGPPGPLGAQPYYLFVGGQLTVPSHLDRILSALADLGVTPDLAGPALYVRPMKAQQEEWEATGAIPTQDELRASCFARLEEISAVNRGYGAIPESQGPLYRHGETVTQHGVPFFACYEAGQSLIAGSHPWRRAALEAQGTEWMGELYREIRSVAESAGVDLLCWYSAATQQDPKDPRVDVFGLLESDEADVSKWLPKARAARGD